MLLLTHYSERNMKKFGPIYQVCVTISQYMYKTSDFNLRKIQPNLCIAISGNWYYVIFKVFQTLKKSIFFIMAFCASLFLEGALVHLHSSIYLQDTAKVRSWFWKAVIFEKYRWVENFSKWVYKHTFVEYIKTVPGNSIKIGSLTGINASFLLDSYEMTHIHTEIS